MATASVPNSFTNSTTADADEMNANFGAVVTFANGSVLHLDGTKTMTGNLDAGSNKITNVATPTASTDAANKSYVDDINTGALWTGSSIAVTSTTPAVLTTESSNPLSWTESSGTYTCPVGGAGMYRIILYYETASLARPYLFFNGTNVQYPTWYVWDTSPYKYQMVTLFWFDEGDTFGVTSATTTWTTAQLRFVREFA